MTISIKNTSLVGVALSVFILAASQANAAEVIFDIDDTSDPYVRATIDDSDTTGLLSFMFDVQTATNLLADLRGVFFNVSNDSLIGSFSIKNTEAFDQGGNPLSGVSILLCQDATGLTSCGNNDNNVNGTGLDFEVAVESGTQGAGDDDIDMIMFDLSYSLANLDLDLILGENFAARLTSVGEIGNREGSLKLTTTAPENPGDDTVDPTGVPEPTTLAVIGSGLLAGSFLARRRKIRG